MTVRTSDLRRVVVARFLSRAGSEAAFFVGIWGKAAFEMGASAYSLAGIMFAVGVSMILGSVVAGVLVDRLGPRRVLMYAEWLFVPAALAVALADTLTALTAIVAVWAFVGAPVQTAAASFAPYLTDDEDELRRVNSWIEGAASASFPIGAAVGALLVRYADVDWVFVLDALTSLVAALLVYKVRVTPPTRDEAAGRGRPLAETAAGLRAVYRRRGLRFYVLSGAVLWLAFGSFGALEPLFFRDVVGTDVEALGWINAVFGAGLVTGAAILPRLPRRIVSARGLAILLALTGMGTALYVGWPDLRVIAVGAFFWSIVIGIMEPLLRTLLHRDSPRGIVGRVMGIAEMHRRGAEILPLAFAPALAAAFGVQATLIAGGFIATVIAVGSLGEARAIDRERGAETAEDTAVEGISTTDDPFLPGI